MAIRFDRATRAVLGAFLAASAVAWGTGSASAAVTDTCGAFTQDYVQGALGVVDAPFTGTLTDSTGTTEALTVTPVGFGTVGALVPSPFLRSEISSGSDDRVLSASPILRTQADGHGYLEFQTPDGAAYAVTESCAVGARVSRIAGITDAGSTFTVSRS